MSKFSQDYHDAKKMAKEIHGSEYTRIISRYMQLIVSLMSAYQCDLYDAVIVLHSANGLKNDNGKLICLQSAAIELEYNTKSNNS